MDSTFLALGIISGPILAPPVLYATELTVIKPEPMGTPVGQLQKKWQFPSDHLPIGLSFDEYHLVSWNVLDAKYMHWVTGKNSQGLKESMIVDEHIYIKGTRLTVRDQHIAEMVLEMIHHPTHPKTIVSLQECSKPFLSYLREKLTANFEIIDHEGNAICFDQTQFKLVGAKEVSGIFSHEPERSFQQVLLQQNRTGQLVRLVNAHLPGDPTKPARFEFGRYLAEIADPTLTTIAMGDMNFNEVEMAEAIPEKAYALHAPYCTNIAPITYLSKAIDHFIVQIDKPSRVKPHRPEEVLLGLKKTSDLL